MKKVSTIAKLPTVARLLALKEPEVFRAMCRECEPMLLPRHAKLIPEIHAKIKEEFPDFDRTDQSILFAGTIYHAYAPATMLGGSDLERLPNGIRPVMCNVMQWKDAPTVNYYSKISQAYFKGHSFKGRVNHILSFFQGYSVKSNQQQLF